MRQILWFRRDLRIHDSAILTHASKEVLPIFIFDKNILKKLMRKDKRMTFIYNAVVNLKKQLQTLGLDLVVFYDTPKNVFTHLKSKGYDEVLCSVDFDHYAKQRDEEIENILPLQRFSDSFLLHPNEHLKNDGTPYKVFTPFFKSLAYLWQSSHIQEHEVNSKLIMSDYAYTKWPTLEEMGFEEQVLPSYLYQSAQEVFEVFKQKIDAYKERRDFFYEDATSNLSVHLRFGLISAKQLFNLVQALPLSEGTHCFIKELFWREFYNSILFHFPYSEFENFNKQTLLWEENEEVFDAWCKAQTGVPIVDAAMQCLNETGTMPNRLRMIVASFATKNLLIPWKKAEQYFAQHLLDYEASSNVGSWQWAASTGADSVPYFRIFNPYLQSKKFDNKGVFIKKYLPQLRSLDAKLFHNQGALNQSSCNYPTPIVSVEYSRKRAIEFYKNVRDTK